MWSKLRFQARLGLGLFSITSLLICLWFAFVLIIGRHPPKSADRFAFYISGLVLASLATSYAASMWLTARLCEPLSELRRRVRSIAEGRWETLVSVEGKDDLSELARDVESIRLKHVDQAKSEGSRGERMLIVSRLAGTLEVNGGVRAVAQRALEIVTRDLTFRTGALYVLGEDERFFDLHAQSGLPGRPSAEARHIAAHHHLLGRLTRAGQVIVTDSAGAQEWLQAVGLSAEAASLTVGVPLRSGERVLGALLLAGGHSSLSPEEVEMLTAVGNQVGAAVDTARAIEDSRRRMAHLEGLLATSNEVARSLNEQAVLQLILTKARELMRVETCAVFRLDDLTQQLQIRDSLGVSAEYVNRAVFPFGSGAVGRAVKERRVVAVRDLFSDADYAKLAPQIHDARYVCALAAPLLSGDRALGGIEIYSSEPREFNEEEQQLLAIFANQAATAIVNAELHGSAERRLSALDALFRTIENVGASTRPKDIMEFVICQLQALFPCNISYVLLDNERTGELEVAASRGLNGNSHSIAKPACWAIKKGKTFEVQDSSRDFNCAELISNGPALSYACAPLTASGRSFGVLHMSSADSHAFTSEQVQLFNTLASNLAIALERAQLFQRVEQLAKTDSLTGLYNYREFRARLDDELRRAQRFNQPVSLMLIDLDHFKQHNDRFGHPSGDAVLRKFAEISRAQTRQVDFLARYGGEEFAVILPNADIEGAEQVAEKLRAAVESEEFVGDPAEPVVRKTISIGVAAYPDHATNAEGLVEKADAALYSAKETGRNRVSVWSSISNGNEHENASEGQLRPR